MWIGFTHWIFRIPKDEYEGMFKKMDELFFRVVSVLTLPPRNFSKPWDSLMNSSHLLTWPLLISS
ncbi:unnamed protein product [Arabidopsis lyrata]|nr:unnamed protein product [Arabidopsis lyrata]